MGIVYGVRCDGCARTCGASDSAGGARTYAARREQWVRVPSADVSHAFMVQANHADLCPLCHRAARRRTSRTDSVFHD